MKVENLMIGDWVIDEYTNRPMRIEAVNKMMGSGLFPIPLTTEILRMNGFRLYARYTGEDIWMEYNHNIEVVITNYASTIRVFTIDDIDDGNNLIYLQDVGRTRYVHELQHALRLCGLNELANNFKI